MSGNQISLGTETPHLIQHRATRSETKFSSIAINGTAILCFSIQILAHTRRDV
uniref:ALA2 n=1 Tax=Arundo donax TaxID=35708 RepID=A0A0A9GWI0_ARUDO